MKMKPEKLFKKLLEFYGSQHWWPGDSPLEICIGAILTQNTSWENVERAIANMKKERVLSIKALNEISTKKLARIIKSSGYYNEKAKKLRAFAGHLSENYKGSLKRFFKKETSELRKELLSIWGIGNETADSMLCYAAGRKVFVVDAYTKRITERYYNKKFRDYKELQSFFIERLEPDAHLFNEFHALLVRHGKDCCKKSKPLCNKCPINKNCYYHNQ